MDFMPVLRKMRAKYLGWREARLNKKAGILENRAQAERGEARRILQKEKELHDKWMKYILSRSHENADDVQRAHDEYMRYKSIHTTGNAGKGSMDFHVDLAKRLTDSVLRKRAKADKFRTRKDQL